MQSAFTKSTSLRLRAVLGAALLCLFVVPELFAQALPSLGELTARQRAELNELNTSEDLDNPTYLSLGDEEADENIGVIKILREGQKYRPLRFSFSTDWFYTSNAALTDGAEIPDNYVTASVGVSWVPRLASPFPNLGTDLYGDFSARFSMFQYADNSFLDFNTVDVGAGLIQVFRGLGDLSVYARYQFEGLINPDQKNVFFDEHSILVGVYKPWDIIPGHYFYNRLESSIALATNPSVAKRDEHSITTGYRYFHTQKLIADAYYRLRYLDFQNIAGEDLNHQLGLGLSYTFNEYVTLGANYSWAANDSNRAGGDYYNHSLGGSLYLQIRM